MNKSRFHTRQTTFRQLETFLAVAEHLSVTEAARTLHLAQPSVSTQLAKLEQALQMELFEQLGKRLYLTDAGREVQAGAREIFDALDRLEMRLAQLNGLTTGQLRLGAVTTAKYLVPRLLGPFCRQYPQVEVQLNIANRSDVIRCLEDNRDDLYVFSQPPDHLDLECVALAENPLVVIAPAGHRLSGQRIRWEQLAQEPFLSREPGSGTRLAIEDHFARHGWPYKPHMTIASNEAIKESVAAGLGIAILSRHTLIHTAVGNLVELDVEDFPIANQWYLVRWRRKALSPAAQAFSSFAEMQAPLAAPAPPQ
ncbi:LysR family transcriptional regulator [Ectopseudomonas hydrolytica]|jgi:DNA-binding transcriptional LysR family regulator|uniref:Transcriptional regulator, LysR family n=1 Tax=Ectopseudomonas mendocina (strain ymp) TaxID=399739 RepID=A4XTW7_ECTM1